jgi:hypothetical protein
MDTESTPKKRRMRISPIVEIVFALGLFVVCVALATHAVRLFIRNGLSFNVVEISGGAMMFLGGCFDPVNFVWLCLPFTTDKVASPGRYSRLGVVIVAVGISVLLIGLIGRLCSG